MCFSYDEIYDILQFGIFQFKYYQHVPESDLSPLLTMVKGRCLNSHSASTRKTL